MNGNALFDIQDLVVRKQASNTTFELVVPNLRIQRGEMVAVIGPSGCGKSTLLDALALAAPVDSIGRFFFAPGPEGRYDVGSLLRASDLDSLAELRRRYMGYVLQTGGLLPFLDVAANILLLAPRGRDDDEPSARRIAASLGIEAHLKKKPASLSAGERQRVAIGRALANRPAAIIADEPTAALDPMTSDGVMALLIEQVERLGASCIVATHDWDRVERLGLRRLRQNFEETRHPGWIRSIIRH